MIFKMKKKARKFLIRIDSVLEVELIKINCKSNDWFLYETQHRAEMVLKEQCIDLIFIYEFICLIG